MTFPYSHLLIAQESVPPPAEAPAGGVAGDGDAATGQKPPSMWPVFMLMLVVMYFVMIRPNQKRAREHRERVESLKIGSKVISAGGIHGLVTNVSDKTVTVKVSDSSKIKFEKASIAQVFASDRDQGDDGTSEAEDDDSDEEEQS